MPTISSIGITNVFAKLFNVMFGHSKSLTHNCCFGLGVGGSLSRKISHPLTLDLRLQ